MKSLLEHSLGKEQKDINNQSITREIVTANEYILKCLTYLYMGEKQPKIKYCCLSRKDKKKNSKNQGQNIHCDNNW